MVGLATAVLVTSHRGQTSRDEAERLAQAGRLPRNSAVEVARALGAAIIDGHYMAERAHPLARLVSRRLGLPAGQVVEVVCRRRRYRQVLAWADRLGLPLALVNKLTRSKQDLVMVSVDLSVPKKAVFLKRYRVQTHLRAMIHSSSVQVDLASGELGVPRDKLHLLAPGVDVDFWCAQKPPTERVICAVGWEARDYATLARAVSGLDVEVEVALGTIAFSSPSARQDGVVDSAERPGEVSPYGLAAFESLRGTTGFEMLQEWMTSGTEGLPSNLTWHQQLKPPLLRELYSRSRFVVIPLRDVSFDAGYTALLEAMAMSKAVILTRTRGQVDIVQDGEQGLYVPPGDAPALRAAVQRLLDDPDEAIRMGSAGRRLVEEQYTLDRYVQQVVGLMREVTDGRGS